MQIVIDISEKQYEIAKEYVETVDDKSPLAKAVVNGTILPKGHGNLIDADALEEDYDWCEYEGGSIVIGYQAYSAEQIENAPIIIKAESGE